jgi:hypothetical protein
VNQEFLDWQELLESALRCGITVADFWAMTPRETYAAIRAAGWRIELEQRRGVIQAWHTAALARAKRLPSLRRLLSPGKSQPLQGDELERHRQERDEILARIDVQKINEAVRKRGR